MLRISSSLKGEPEDVEVALDAVTPGGFRDDGEPVLQVPTDDYLRDGDRVGGRDGAKRPVIEVAGPERAVAFEDDPSSLQFRAPGRGRTATAPSGFG